LGKKVKGFLFLDYVRMLKSRKEVDWRRHLPAEDLPFLDREILESEWYPFETFERLGLAIMQEIARGDMQMPRVWGRASVDNLFSQYRSLICEGDPRESLVRFQVLRRSFFDFGAVDIQVLFGTFAKIVIAYGMSRLAEEAACHQALGFFERLLELSGASELRYQFTAKSWEGAKATILELNWNEEKVTRRVKGFLFADYARMIKSKKDVDWSRYLQEEDLLYLKQRIQDSDWYPMETFERMGIGILQEIAKDSVQLVRMWGKMSIAGLVQLHGTLVCPGDPRETLMRFMVLRRSFFDFNAFDLRSVAGNSAQFEISYEMSNLAEEAASFQALGFFEKLLELSGAVEIQHRFLKRVWAGDATTILELIWQEPAPGA